MQTREDKLFEKAFDFVRQGDFEIYNISDSYFRIRRASGHLVGFFVSKQFTTGACLMDVDGENFKISEDQNNRVLEFIKGVKEEEAQTRKELIFGEWGC